MSSITQTPPSPLKSLDETITGHVSKICPSCGSYWTKCKPIFLIFLIAASLIFMNWFRLMIQHESTSISQYDPMNVEVLRIEGMNVLSLWPIMHFVLFTIITFLYPDCWVLILTTGIVWELFEVLCSKIFNYGYQPHRTNQASKTLEYQSGYWAGSWRDIIMNSLGVLFGYWARQVYDMIYHWNHRVIPEKEKAV